MPPHLREVPVSEGVDIPKLRVNLPIILLLTFLASAIAGSWAVFSALNRLTGHVENQHSHVDPQEAFRGGGPAYKNDLRDLRHWMETTLRHVEIECHKVPKSDVFRCRVELPHNN